ncbi:alpha-hydroxy acid oxidase [Arthrobacter sulfonylureivorans]|uniref:Alpha-hydroxy-acid oxidizing protein n=1 Tax=Arthrobacter sulfonylureivorans TaxID=2486855 RepID=A0ABY3WAF0_9MICC|nr:alpha-hydroxy acid oxidase [Arthrobacter sulfonylureivorans]UNK47309.1 alpha-hydroxy-acid oxidizing protein [Arthrobacter sulfonylureivorans]
MSLRTRIRDFSSLVQLQAPALPTTASALHAARDIGDVRELARRRTPRFVFDYVDGGSFREESVAYNQTAFAGHRFAPRVLRPVGQPDLSAELLGGRTKLPIGLAPTGLTGLSHPEGEKAVARAAAAFGVPFSVSTMATSSIEDVAAAAPDSRRWFQLYLRTDRAKSLDLIRRALNHGYESLVLTVDTAVAGRRLRDDRNGLALPPKLRVDTFFDTARHPGWALRFLANGAPKLANFSESTNSISELVSSMFDPQLSFDDLDWLREQWPKNLIIKGVLHPDDARTAFDHGADAVWVSNHGGRQMDRTVAPIDVIAEIRAAVGPHRPLILDSGIRSGLDVAAALAAGADFVHVGRAFLYGLMAGGQPGVERVLQILSDETRNAMQLLGAATITDLRQGQLHAPLCMNLDQYPEDSVLNKRTA